MRAIPLLLLLCAVSGCDLAQGVIERQAITRAEFSYDHVDLKALDIPLLTPDAGVKLDVVLGVKNPNAVTARLDRLDYTVQLAGTQVATGSMTQDFSVAPNATQSLVVPLSLPYATMPSGVFAAIQARSTTVTIEGTSHLTTPWGDIGFPVTVSHDLTF